MHKHRTHPVLISLLWTACAAMPLLASSLNPVTVAIMESSGGKYFDPVGRRIVIEVQPIRLFIRIRNTSEASVMIRARPEKAYALELKDQGGQTFIVKRKNRTGGDSDDDVRVNLAPGADKIIPMEINRDTWEGIPDLKPDRENTYTVRVVYEDADGRTVYSESYTLTFRLK